MSAKSKTSSMSKPPSKPKKPSSSRVAYPEDIEAAEVSRSRKAAMLQLRMGRLAHGLSIASGLALAATAVLVYLLQNWDYLLTAPEYVTVLKWIVPLAASLAVAVLALAFKWEPYFADRSDAHFVVSFIAVAVPAIFITLIALDEGGYVEFGRPDWLYPMSLLGMSLTFISLAMAWEGHGRRKVVSIASAVFPPALLTFPIIVQFTDIELASILPMAYLGSAVAMQLSGSMLHIISSTTSVQEREVLKASDGKLKVLLEEVDKRKEALEYREDAMRSRESDLEAYEKRLTEEMASIDEAKRQIEKMEAEAELRVDNARREEEGLAKKEADIEAKLDTMRLTQADLDIQGKQLEKSSKVLATKEQKFASREGELSKLILDAQAKQREAANKAAELEASEVELNAWDKELQVLQKELSEREKQVSIREGSVDLKGIELLAAKQQLGKVVAEKTTVKTLEQQLLMKQEAMYSKEIALKAREDELRKASERAQRLIERSDKQMNELVDKEADVLTREKALAGKEAELKNALSSLNDQLADAERVKSAVSDREKQYMSLTEATRAKMAGMTTKEQDVERKAAALARREESAKELEKRLKAEQDQMNSKLRMLLEKEKDLKAEEAKVALRQAELESMERETLYTVDEVEKIRHEPEPEPDTSYKAIELRERHLREKEQEMKSRLYQREKELEQREHALQAHLRKDLDEMETDVETEVAEEKVKTGIERLDDLLLGGMPFSSNVLFVGPPFIGKETAMLLLIAEGLKKGVPAVIITTSRPPHEIAGDMAPIMPTFMEFEQLGLVHWIDASGLSQDSAPRRNSTRVRSADDFAGITKALDATIKTVLASGRKYFRLAYLSLSMSITSADEKKTVQFVQELSSKVRQAHSVAVYAVERGMHTDQQLGSIQAQMTGAVHFKTEKQKTLLSVEGVCDAQTRNWVDYRHTNKSLMIGAFSLERIR
ncbi:MAG: ATPase protein [Candidatus Thermoplasmatota archaeon]|nr:ATPase protein [Candidatus Thermoplasmatota archaeon]